MALSRIKLEHNNIHEDLMLSIFTNLQPEQPFRGISGSHWEELGFQGSDPRTDVRGAGILGLLHLLYFAEAYPKSSRCLLQYSNQPSTHFKTSRSFPFAIKLFEFTVLILKLLREGVLFGLCNRHSAVT